MKSGIVLAMKFCPATDKRFSGYIDYIDRDEAIRNENIEKYNLYQDYMGNPEKSTGLFTSDKDCLDKDEKIKLKKIFKAAQEKGSLMWQPVISFDNKWLQENGLYDEEHRILDEIKIKEYTRKSVSRMLEKEGLDHAIWSASCHYNTDNIHIHIAITEPVPMRETKLYQKYDYIPDAKGDYIFSKYGTFLKATAKNMQYYAMNTARYKREAVQDQEGNPIMIKEYVGRFKQSSIDLCKSTFVNEVLREKDYSIKLNSLIRNSIIKRKKEVDLAVDPELKDRFKDLHAEMTDLPGNRGLWNYNSNLIKPLQPKIDELSDLYLKKYHPEEFQEFQKTVWERSKAYKKAYGETNKDYESGKMQDLHTRLGNVILKEIKEYDKKMETEGSLTNIKLGVNTEGPLTDIKLGVATREPLNDVKLGAKTESFLTNRKNIGKGRVHEKYSYRLSYRLDRALRALQRSMDEEYASVHRENQLEHERLQQQQRE